MSEANGKRFDIIITCSMLSLRADIFHKHFRFPILTCFSLLLLLLLLLLLKMLSLPFVLLWAAPSRPSSHLILFLSFSQSVYSLFLFPVPFVGLAYLRRSRLLLLILAGAEAAWGIKMFCDRFAQQRNFSLRSHVICAAASAAG